MKFEKIFEPIVINKTVFKNRMVVSAMVTNYCEENGMPNEKFIKYHQRKAEGGWGIIITEDFAISPAAGGFKRLPGLWCDEQIAPYKAFTDSIHERDGKIIAQIYHAGRETSSAVTGVNCVAPSAIKDPTMPEVPYELTKDQIIQIEDEFADCAYRAQQAGFDGVEIHGAHGYLVEQFVSPFSNHRTDEYGGTIYNRCRFALEIVHKIREKCGSDFVVFYRMSAVEYVHGGLEIEESKVVARLLEEAGVDCLHVSQGVYASIKAVIPVAGMMPGCYVNNAAEIKKAVSIPVIAVGRINDPLIAESIIASGKADLCTMARASLADPDLPKKTKEGRYDEIIHCIGCVQGCSGENGKGNKVRCLVNPMTGMEDEYVLEKAEKPKNIVVAGGGVAGSEAAVIAAMRGHHVTLLEKSGELGGQWIAASIPPGKADFTSFLNWQKQMMKKYNVNVVLNCEADKSVIDSYHPDLVIAATGSTGFRPSIPGLKEYSIDVLDVLRSRVHAGNKAVVIGGGLSGSETADYLAEHGCSDVTIVEMMDQIVREGEATPSALLKERLAEFHVNIQTSAKVTEVTKDSVSYEKNGEVVTISDVDTIIAAIGVRANTALADSLKGAEYEVISCGDCNVRAKNGYKDIREGFEAGLAA